MPLSTPWRHKAQRLIAAMCHMSYTKANTRPDGTHYRRHRPYSVPVLAEELLACLNTNDEARAKAIFLSYDAYPEEYR